MILKTKIKLLWVIKHIDNKFNGTGKELIGRERLFNFLNIAYKKIPIVELNSYPPKELENKLILIDYLRSIPNKNILKTNDIYYRAHHFESLHRFENLLCLVFVFFKLRAFRFLRLITEIKNMAFCIFNEIRAVRNAKYVLCVSKHDTKLWSFFSKKIIYFPYVTNYQFNELNQTEIESPRQNNKKNILMLGAVSPSPNILYNYIEFHDFTKKYRDKYNFSCTGDYSRLNISDRGNEIFKYFKSLPEINFPKSILLADIIYIGSLYGRGVKTKIYDVAYANKPFLVKKRHLYRLKYYLIDFEILDHIDDLVLIIFKSNVNEVMDQLFNINCEEMNKILNERLY